MFCATVRSSTVHVVSDASGSFGCGAILGQSYWFQVTWPLLKFSIDIATKELLPIVIAAAIWGKNWHTHPVQLHTDNTAVKRSARVPCTHHCFDFYTTVYQFDYCVTHISEVENVAADAVSRDNIRLVHSLLPQATKVEVPQPLLEILLVWPPNWGSRQWITLFTGTLQVLSHHQPSVHTTPPHATTGISVHSCT